MRFVSRFVMAIGIMLPALTIATEMSDSKSDIQSIADKLAKQVEAGPIPVREGLYLTNIEFDKANNRLKRDLTYQYVDIDQISERQADSLYRASLAELYPQCEEFHEWIYNDKVTMRYMFRDMNERMFISIDISRLTCSALDDHYKTKTQG